MALAPWGGPVAVDPEKVVAAVLAVAPAGREAPALVKRGEELREEGELDGALLCFDRALRHDDACAAAWTGRSLVLSARGRDREALGCISRAVDADPKNPVALLQHARLLKGRQLLEEALTSFEAALAAGGGAEARAGRDELLKALGRPPVSARPDPRAEKKSIRKSLASATLEATQGADPLLAHKSDPAIALGATSTSDGRAGPATSKRPSLRRSSSASSRPVTQAEADAATMDGVRELVAEGRLVEALRKLEPLAQRLPAAREPWIVRARILLGLKQHDAAVSSAERILKVDPRDREALVIVVAALRATNKDVRALEVAERLFAAFPDDPAALRTKADCLVGVMRHVEAVSLYQRLLQLDPEDASAHVAFGRTLRQLRRAAEARTVLERAVQLASAAADERSLAEAHEVLAKLA
ncbi:MAG: hypothetical protein JWP97_3502 [Labilithrix sp.]|nr:hypothetical protein [Labilithrix sp.]